MSEDLLSQAQRAIGHNFDNPELLERSFTHASVTESRLESNERLEFLGDAVLGLVVSERIFRLYPDMLEGEMTKLKSTVVSRQTCADIARKLGLDELLVLGKGMRNQSEIPQSLAAASLESVIAAIYLDGGFEAAERFIHEHTDELIKQAAECGHQENFKSVLQQFAQRMHSETPTYRVLDEKGPDHAKAFKVGVDLAGHKFEPAWGQSKKRAEQLAALNALRHLGIVEENNDGRLTVVESPDESADTAAE